MDAKDVILNEIPSNLRRRRRSRSRRRLWSDLLRHFKKKAERFC